MTTRVLQGSDIDAVSAAARTAQAEMQAQLTNSPPTLSVTVQNLTDWIAAVDAAANRLEELSGVIV